MLEFPFSSKSKVDSLSKLYWKERPTPTEQRADQSITSTKRKPSLLAVTSPTKQAQRRLRLQDAPRSQKRALSRWGSPFPTEASPSRAWVSCLHPFPTRKPARERELLFTDRPDNCKQILPCALPDHPPQLQGTSFRACLPIPPIKPRQLSALHWLWCIPLRNAG